MNVFQCLSCQHSSFPVTREMVRLKPCTLCASEVKYACQCCINHQKRWAKGQIQSHQDQWTFFSPIKSHELWIRSRRMSELCQPHWETVVQMLVCCLASHSCEVKQRLADVSFMERILVLMSRIPQRDAARGSSCLSAWRQSRAYPSSGCCVWGHPLPSDTHWGTPASCISCYLVLPGSSSFLLLLHSTASNNWKDLVLTALRVWKPQKKNVAFVLYIVPFLPL